VRQSPDDDERPLRYLEKHPFGGDWKMDTLGIGDIMTFRLRAHEDVTNVNFVVTGVVVPAKDAEAPYDVTVGT
jgi:hypothetical protein